MLSAKKYFFLVLILMMQIQSHGQKAIYSDGNIGYEVKIAGSIGENIHVWSSQGQPSRFYLKNTALTLYVFSADMHLKEEKQIELGAVKTWNIDFQFDDTCYYANIVTLPDLNKRLLLKVDQNGNTTDVSDRPELWRKSRAMTKPTWEQTVLQKGNFAYAAKVENYNIDNSNGTNIITVLPGTNINDADDFKKLIVRKKNIQTGETTQHTYVAAGISFFYPLLQLSDTAVLVSAFTEPQAKLVFNKSGKGPFIFFARLDTSLSELSNGPVLLKNKKNKSEETFLPKSILPSGKGFFIVSTGQYQDPDAYFWPNISLRVTQIDEKNNLVRDTIIKDKSGQERLQWDNIYIVNGDDGIDVFCALPYSASKSGIAHLTIGSNGKIKEKDMMVEGLYDYFLPAAKKLSPGVLLVPFTHNGKTTLLKLEYD
jgi:hypothetical protein